MISREDVLAARETITGRVHRTPTLTSASLAREVGVPVYLKAELFQRTGSFKPRGVLNKLASLSPEEKTRGVIGISAGNHAQALAYASALEDVDAPLGFGVRAGGVEPRECLMAYDVDERIASRSSSSGRSPWTRPIR